MRASRRLGAAAAEVGYSAGWNLLQLAPHVVADRGFRLAADLASVRNGPGTRQLRKNLRRVAGPGTSEVELDALVGAALRSYARYWLETFRLPRMEPSAVLARTSTEGVPYLDDAIAAGRGAVLAMPHQGNWDVAGMWLVARHGPFVTVAERLRPESVFNRFVAYRESLGFEVLPLSREDPSPLGPLGERLRANRVACLVADRDLSRSGVQVDFFGEPARLPGGPAMLAVTTGAPLLPVSLWYTPDGGWGQRINPPLQVPAGRLRDQVSALTQALADVFEKDIAEHPTDWHMLQRLWIADFADGPSERTTGDG